MELKLWALMLLIIDRDALRRPRPGTQAWVLDAGANDGATSFMLANALSRHGGRPTQVLAVEPLPNNVLVAQGHARRAGNMHVVHAGLGDVNGSVGYYPKHLELRAGGAAAQIAAFRPNDNVGDATYPIVTIDALFGDGSAQTLVLAHLDLEGREPNALHGANATLTRDRPVITVETYPVSMHKWHSQVMECFEALNYDVYTVDETVGYIRDGRNHVAVPREDRLLRRVLSGFFAHAKR